MNEQRPDILVWTDGQPCSKCSKPTESVIHSFEVSKQVYRAPLYHLTEYKAGFCGPACATAFVIEKHKTVS